MAADKTKQIVYLDLLQEYNTKLNEKQTNTDAAVANQVVTAVKQTDGVVTVTRRALEAADIPDLTLAKITDAGTAAAEDVATAAIADDSTDASLVTAAQVAKYVKDKTADITGVLHFRGVVASLDDITDPKDGDVAIVGTTEYIYASGAWKELGDESNYVPKTRKIGTIDLVDDITVAEMQTELEINPDAEENVLEGVQVNGTDLTVDANKKVNVTIAEGTTDGTIAVNGTDVSVHGLGDMAYEDAADFVSSDDIVYATKADIDALFS